MIEGQAKTDMITLDKKNVRTHPDANKEAIKKSLSELGGGRSILLDADDVLIAGNGVYEQAAALGLPVRTIETDGTELIAVKRTDLSTDDEKRIALAIADNRLTDLSEFDTEALNVMLDELSPDMQELAGYAVDPNDLMNEGNTNEDEVPEVTEATCKLGDLWILGNHRLLCGDSTDKEQVEKLMDGEKADMVFTDPPYGISVVGKNGSIGKGVLAKEGVYKPVIGDDEDYDPTHLLGLADKMVIWGANYFCDKLPIGQWIVWDKDRPEGTTFSDCELAWTNGEGVAVNKYKCTWNGMVREGESGERVHPTQKPLKVCSEVIGDFSNETDIITDLFLGSGSTLIACEKTNRKCYGMELDPHYCDVIIKRWEDYTGESAVLDARPS